MQTPSAALLFAVFACGNCCPAVPIGGGTPVLSYSTYFGGTGKNDIRVMTRDAAGNIYLAGTTSATDFPVTPGAFQASPGTWFVAKLNASATQILFATYFGTAPAGVSVPGAPFVRIDAIAADASGNVYLAGGAGYNSIPIVNALQPNYYGDGSAFVAKLDPTGSRLLFSTYLSGSGGSTAVALTLDTQGNPVVVGNARTATGPISFQPALRGAGGPFVAKLDSAGNRLIYTTYLSSPGSGSALAAASDREGNIYVLGGAYASDFPTTPGAFQTAAIPGGYTCFVTKLNAGGDRLVYSTLLGSVSSCGRVTVDGAGSAWVAGTIDNHSQLPVTAGAIQSVCVSPNAFVAGINAAGTGLVYSTYLGGSSSVYPSAIAVDAAGNVYVAGTAYSGFSVKNPIQSAPNCAYCWYIPCPFTRSQFGCRADAYSTTDFFIAGIDPAHGNLLFSTFLGSQGGDSVSAMTVDAAGNLWLAGSTGRTAGTPGYGLKFGGWFSDFPLTSDALFSTIHKGNQGEAVYDGFLVKLSPGNDSFPVPFAGVVAGRADGTAAVYGAGYTPRSIVQVNGSSRPTRYVDETQLVFSLLSGDTVGAANPLVRVVNTLAGGGIVGISNSVTYKAGTAADAGAFDIKVAALDGGVPAGGIIGVGGLSFMLPSDGRLRLAWPANSDDSVSVAAPGYRTAFIDTRIFPGGTDSLDVTLVPVGVGTWSTRSVAATSEAFDSGIDVKAGQSLIIYAAGRWSFWPFGWMLTGQNLTGEGLPGCRPYSGDWPLPGNNCGALAARIGDGPWFHVGQAFAGTAPSSGRLYFAMNYRFGSFTHNTGNLTLAVGIVDLRLVGLREPEIRATLPGGFYVAEATLVPEQPKGYWSMEVSAAAGLAGGLIAGGGIQESNRPPAWAAFSLGRPGTVRIQTVAQVLPGGDPAKFSMTARLLDGSRNQIGTDQLTISGSLDLARTLGGGFYIVELRGGASAPLAAFQLGISADAMAGPAYAGGYIVPGLSGFGAFYLPQQQDVKIKASGAPANGPEGAGNLELRLLDANRNLINSAP
jgi:hypothetical protein